MTRLHALDLAIAGALALAGVAAFVAFAGRIGAEGRVLVAGAVVFALWFMPCPVLAVGRWASGLAAWLAAAPAPRTALLWIVALAAHGGYAAAHGAFALAPLLTLAAYGVVPVALVAWRNRGATPLESPWRLALALAALWLPIELRVIGGLLVPAAVPGAFDAARLAVFALALALFVAAAPVPDVGYTFRLRRRDARDAALAFAAFAAVAVPLGMAIGFIRIRPAPFEPLEWAAQALGIYVLVALPEELLFRGLIQNLAEKRWIGRRARGGSLVVAALIFGAAHLDPAPDPNFRYALLATLAGLAYGWVWQRSRKITAAALTHAAVDWVWVHVFRGG